MEKNSFISIELCVFSTIVCLCNFELFRKRKSSPVFFWGTSFYRFKLSYKITDIVKAAIKGNFGNSPGRMRK